MDLEMAKERLGSDTVYEIERAYHRTSALRRLLEQDQYWVTKDGQKIQLTQMSSKHRDNLRKWLKQRAEMLWGLEQWESLHGPQLQGEMSLLSLEQAEGYEEQFEDDPVVWLMDKPLYKRLQKLS